MQLAKTNGKVMMYSAPHEGMSRRVGISRLVTGRIRRDRDVIEDRDASPRVCRQ